MLLNNKNIIMSKIIPYVGKYQYNDKKLINNEGLKLLIANRGNTSKTKTPLFLLDKSTPKGSYVSSLYPLNDMDAYSFDYKGFRYNLKIDETKGIAEIQQV